MSSIDFANKVVVVTDLNFIGLDEKWLAELKEDGYEIRDFRKLVPEKRRASDELS